MFNRNNFFWYQLSGWFIVYILFMLYTYLRIGDALYAVAIATVAFLSFATIVYTYTLFLYPKLYHANKVSFSITLLLTFALVSFIRIVVETHFVARLFSGNSFFNSSTAHISYVLVTNFIALVLAVLLKHVSMSFIIMKKQKEMERKQLITEMKLLKAQLQPHFLFNSLNNIYYETYRESPKAALLIEKLSQIMRFFLEINMKEKIPIETELLFIKNIIDLEQVRCYNPIAIEINSNEEAGIFVPPMLMVPLVENALKHGIDKTSPDNYIFIEIQRTAQHISFLIRNRLHPDPSKVNQSGTGLKNLEERLTLLYADNYTLYSSQKGSEFIATLMIPKT